MDKKAKELKLVRLLADSVHATAEMVGALYEQDRPYRREDLRQCLDAKHLEAAQIIAELFLNAAQLRDGEHLRALFDSLFDAWEVRHQRRQFSKLPAQLKAIGLGISGDEFFRRRERMDKIVAFLVMEILCIAFELVMFRKGGSDFGSGATAAYLVNTVPELRAPCPIEEDLSDDVDQEENFNQEGLR